jgi:histidinol dehydrogenase
MLRIRDTRRGDDPPSPARVSLDPEVTATVAEICERVRAEGDAALVDLTRRYDGADVGGRLHVTHAEIEDAAARVPKALRQAIERMAERLRALSARQLPVPWWTNEGGIAFGEVVRPLAAVGCYVPGGRAAYPSTVVMTAVPAKVAGVDRVSLCTPPAADGSIPPVVLFAARAAGVNEVFRVGGAQAVAALAYGTETIRPVDKIVGPGNVWVTAAKREVMGVAGIDGLAGPTELVVVADGTADPEVLAVDLVAQAEHDPVARVVLVTWEEGLPERVVAAVEAEAAASSRGQIVRAALAEAEAVLVSEEDEAAAVVDRLAPEHLQVVTADPRHTLERIRAFGAAFLGPDTPVTLGDYGAWSNHVLPTMATARFSSGLRASDFVTVSSVVEAGPDALAAIGPELEAVAAAEGLPGHARAIQVRR